MVRDKEKLKKYMKKYMKEYYKNNKETVLEYVRHSQNKKKNINYDNDSKNEVRNKIIELIKDNNIKTILTLESEKFLFAKLVPEKKVYVFEYDNNNFNKMKKSKPKNVILNYGYISEFANYDMYVDFIYLDFCNAYSTSKEEIYLLKEKIKHSKYFGVTFCLRDTHRVINGDYQFDLINNIQNITGINWRILYGKSYRNSASMITIIFENPNK